MTSLPIAEPIAACTRERRFRASFLQCFAFAALVSHRISRGNSLSPNFLGERVRVRGLSAGTIF
jgi:hypothetical protein